LSFRLHYQATRLFHSLAISESVQEPSTLDALREFHPLRSGFPANFTSTSCLLVAAVSYTTIPNDSTHGCPIAGPVARLFGFFVWAFPFSLAVTLGITVVFFSSAY